MDRPRISTAFGRVLGAIAMVAALATGGRAEAASCQWTYYPIAGGQLQAEQPFFNDPDNTPIGSLSVGAFFKTSAGTPLARTGSTDFNADGKTDVFRTTPRSDGLLQWAYTSGGASGWQDLAYAGTNLPAAELQFGDLDGDGFTDAFGIAYNRAANAYEWVFSPEAAEDFVLLHSTPTFLDRVALGDFDGDGTADVFTVSQRADGFYQWAYFPNDNGLLGLAQPGAYDSVFPSRLRFGDFDGDAVTDVFSAVKLDDGSTQWVYSSGGAASFVPLATSTVPYAELRLGDVDGDGITDVLAALPQSDGGLDIVSWSGGHEPHTTLGHIAAPAPALRVGDFNGDGIADLLALRCGMSGPLAFGPLQILAPSEYRGFSRPLLGDVNGDGRADVILFSRCQIPSEEFCETNHPQLGAALTLADGTHRLVAPVLLDATNTSFDEYRVVAGDFDGDGKTDVALMNASSPRLTLYIARSNGDGTFTLGAAQTFVGDFGGLNAVARDFTGDGKTDIALMSVCIDEGDGCGVGDDNEVVVATSTGNSFTVGTPQHFGAASGWRNYVAVAGDVNGDGKADLIFNSLCQKASVTDQECTLGDANIVYTAVSTGDGGFEFSTRQTISASGWADYRRYAGLSSDVNGDGRDDLVLWSSAQTSSNAHDQLIIAMLAGADGTFQIGPVQNFGSTVSGGLSLADVNRDGKADLLWTAPGDADDVATYTVAKSNGDATFTVLGTGAVYTGPGEFNLAASHSRTLPTGVTFVSTRQNDVSDAAIVVSGRLNACLGDCNGDGAVTVNELILGVNIALGSQPLTACPAFANAQNTVAIAQLVTGVANALNGC